MRARLSDELDAVRRDLARWGGDLPVDVTGSRLDRREGGHYLYAMSLERRVQAPPFTTTEIRLRNGKALTGTIEEVHEKGHVFIVATEVPIPEEGRGAILAFTPTEVLEAMLGILATVHPVVEETKRERVWRTVGLRETGSSADAVAHPVLSEGRLNAGQRGAAYQVLGSELTAVIGPPGTGKTLTLGATVTAAVEALDRKVLVVAHTNGALDLALKAVIDVAEPALL
ncbi:MAG: AAA domain-containing protein, partial [Gemmatimonadaceae bacterium]